ncbi:AAA family ATPase [Clostridium sp. SHJSY1]|uniref:AAA family ATPase n=1 Tax=Clostridium sp. SHJSY1 TaxID=2942483 RepID=UPI00287663BD|nr:AAA family ATPase [Clostridium sp. SHJSY1]MDS0526065.1 AAA family ATPase [Clostridium sp. SHJSY1]
MTKNKLNKDVLLKPNVLMRILFPEIQVLEHIKGAGIINKELFQKGRKATNNAMTNANNTISKTVAKKASNTLKAAEEIDTRVKNNIGTSSMSGNTRDIYLKNNKNRDELDKAFCLVENKLNEYVLGQNEFLDKLTIAFKRPFVYGKEDGISNIIFVTGPKGSGRHLAIKAITKFLKEEKILKRTGNFQIDLSKYKLEKDAENLFLPDLYNALYRQEPVVVFDNFDKCHSSVLDTITNLGINEKLKLNKRYMDQVDQMIEVTGKGNLTLNTTDEILANGKYIVFVTEKSENEIKSSFPSKFMQKVYDIVKTESLSDDNLSIICEFILEDYRKKIENNLAITVNFHESALKFIVKNSDKLNGAHALNTFVEESIYKPLVELELNEKLLKNKTYTLSDDENSLVLLDDLNKIKLSGIIKQADKEGLEELNKELDNIIGLDSVKSFIKRLQDNIKVQNLRVAQGSKAAKLSLHMIFTGNPGTGKTTMARIMAKYLKILGYLSSGHLVEVSRNDLVGQYVGETAQKTMAKVNAAKGGILFIDEAYSLARDENDVFGIEAVDSLVKAVEDNRDDLVVILAGYSKEMEEFLKTNSGLKSRFNYNVDFEDYTPKELLQISKVISQSNGYEINEELDAKLIELFESKQIKGKNDSGNGRLARNIVEQAIANQSKRLAGADENKINKSDLNKLMLSDFGLDKKIDFNLEDELSKIIGLGEVKEFVRNLEKQLKANEKRKRLGVSVESSQSLNMIFTGNPGTGKTTVARLVADLMKKMGILKSGQVIETDRSGLVSQYLGESTKKTTEIFKSALGGVLFIDEAYALMSTENDSLGKEAVDTLVKLVEDHREDIIVILAGYDKEMNEFLKSNSGLKSRFPLKINFPDYTVDELLSIGKSMIKSKGFILSDDAEDELRATIDSAKKNGGAEAGNGRLVRNVVEEAIRRQSSRIADMEEINEESVVILYEEDFGKVKESDESFDLEGKLNEVIGLEEVKEFIKSLQAQLKIKAQRKELALPVDDSQTLHMIFKGNPGTGKTTMARIIGEVFYNLGVLNDKKFVETDRGGLVAGYVGQTAIKTKEKIESALGGILFIDEAYSLAQDANTGGGFGKEVIDTLVKGMDDNRENLVVILAGYSEDMDKFLDVNPGLKSRFANIIEFKDYSAEELVKIADITFKNKGYAVSNKARGKMKLIFEEALKIDDFGNGRYVRNLFEKAVRNQAVRLEKVENLTKEDLIMIEADDISKVNL